MSNKSVTQILYHKKCVLNQIPLSTTCVVYYGMLTIHQTISCHKALVQKDV